MSLKYAKFYLTNRFKRKGYLGKWKGLKKEWIMFYIMFLPDSHQVDDEIKIIEEARQILKGN